MKRYLLILLFIAPAIIIILNTVARMQNVSEYTLQGQNVFATGNLDIWNAKIYETITTDGVFSNKLFSLQIKSGPFVTEDKIQSLRESLYGFFMAYSQGSYEQYLAFRSPSGVPIVWLKDRTNELNLYFTRGPKKFGSLDLYHEWRDKYHNPTNKFLVPDSLDAKFKTYVSDLSGGNFYKNYWQAVSLKEAIVTVEDSSSLPEPLEKYPFFPLKEYHGYSAEATFPNLGYSKTQYLKYFDFENNQQTVLNRDGHIMYASAFFFLRCAPPEKTTPMLVRFFWENSSRRWLPCELIQANIRQRHRNIPVF
jgi:hypothetical protein